MTRIRGAVLWPLGPDDAVYLPDGVVEPGLAAPRAPRDGDPEPEKGLVIPAFGDWHFHWVQLGIAGRGSAPLLDWLRDAAWPAETRFADPAACARGAALAVSRLAAVGTYAGASYGSPHAASASAFLERAPGGFVCGPAVMSRGEPASLVRPIGAALAEIEELVATHFDRVVVSPRFAPSCDAAALKALGTYARVCDLPIQTHLSETPEEVAEVRRLFPECRDYTDVYERAGLLGPRTLLGHVVHISDDELERIAEAEAVVVHCPTSNRALGSGRMPLERLRRHGVRWVLGSDVGAGPDLCLLDVVAAALDVHAGLADVSAAELFHRATLGRSAVFGGLTEGVLERLDQRPGVLVVRTPENAGDTADPETWFRALVDGWRADRRLRLLRAVPWST